MMAPAPAVTAARASSSGVPESRASASGAPSRRSSENAVRSSPTALAIRPSASSDGRVHEQPAAQASERPYQRTLHGAAGEGVEIGDIPLVAAEDVAVGAREDEWIARRAAVHELRADRRIGFAPATPRQHGLAAPQVQYRDYAQ